MSVHWDAVQRIYPVSRETFERLELYVDRLTIWQKKTNLIAPSTLDDIWSRHICDSLQCVALKPCAKKWVDIGSGGGFPGLVITAAIADFPNASVTLIESNQKKCAFLRQINRQMGGIANVICERIEEVQTFVNQPEIVTARALADLPLLLDLSNPWLSAGAIGLFHKGRGYQQEIIESRSAWEYDLVEHKSKISSESVLLEISNLKQKHS